MQILSVGRCKSVPGQFTFISLFVEVADFEVVAMVLDQKVQEVLLECRYVNKKLAIIQVYPGSLGFVIISPT